MIRPSPKIRINAIEKNDKITKSTNILGEWKEQERKKADAINEQGVLSRKTLKVEDLFIYRWPIEQNNAEFNVLQEQICDYLSLKSFKRKYPSKCSLCSTLIDDFFILISSDLHRRTVDLHEREYLRSENVVSESQCDLGLTALKLSDVLNMIANDYPDKYQVEHQNESNVC